MTQGEQGAVNEPGEYFRLGNRSQPRQRRFAFFEEPRYAVAVAGIMVLGIVLRIAATWPMSMHHPDEVIQYLEQAHRLVFGYGVIPWEYRYGMRQWLLPLLLAGPMKLGDLIAPASDLYLMLPRMAVAMLSISIMAAALKLGNGISRLHGLVAMFVAAIWFEFVHFAAHTLTEPLATAVFLCAAVLLLRPFAASTRAIFWGGLLLGLTAILRFHYLPAIAVLALFTSGKDVKERWLPLAAGGLTALAGAGLIDLMMGATPFAWMVENFRMNITENRAADFGVSGPLAYFGQMLSYWQLAAIPLLMLARSVKPYQPLFWAAVVNLGVHMLIGHKEYRFIFLSISVFIIFAALGSVDLMHRLQKWFPRGRAWGLLTPVALVLCWTALSLSLADAKPMRAQWTTFDGALNAMKTVGRTKRYCGVGLYHGQIWVAGYSYLHRPIPIYILGIDVPDITPAAQLAAASPAYNAILASPGAAADMPSHYRLQRCFGGRKDHFYDPSICVFERPGGCFEQAGEELEIQKVLLRRDR
ncbi:MAG TPA: hypothetical protein VIR65_11250 [Rhizorhapis sp.]